MPQVGNLAELPARLEELRRFRRKFNCLRLSEKLSFAVIVENKIGTGEHDDQLERYWNRVAERYPKLNRFGILLSSGGIFASHPKYTNFSYRELVAILGKVLAQNQAKLSKDIQVILRHYPYLVRTNFMEDTNAAHLAWRISLEHRDNLCFSDAKFVCSPDAIGDETTPRKIAFALL